MDVGEDGVAVITITNPPVNSISRDVLQSLQENYEQALRRDDVKAVVLTGSKEKFSGGADLTTFVGESGKGNQQKIGYLSIDVLTDTFEAARKPSVAAIDGFAFGGGLEVAMVCHARISTSNAQLGLTELHFGPIPALGDDAGDVQIEDLEDHLPMEDYAERIRR